MLGVINTGAMVARRAVSLTIGSPATNYNAATAAGGVSSGMITDVVVRVNAAVSSTSSATPALSLGNLGPAKLSRSYLFNNNTITGFTGNPGSTGSAGRTGPTGPGGLDGIAGRRRRSRWRWTRRRGGTVFGKRHGRQPRRKRLSWITGWHG